MPQNARNTEQQFSIYMAVAENLVGIGAVAMDGLGEPCDGAPLCLQLGLDQMSEMNVFHCNQFWCASLASILKVLGLGRLKANSSVLLLQQKIREIYFPLEHRRYRQTPCNKSESKTHVLHVSATWKPLLHIKLAILTVQESKHYACRMIWFVFVFLFFPLK